MSPVRVRFHHLAAKEYRQARRWYARRSALTALDFDVEITNAIDRIKQSPNQAAVYVGQVRWVRTRRYPYVPFYGPVGPGEVEILAVAHGRRRPGYWTRRIRH